MSEGQSGNAIESLAAFQAGEDVFDIKKPRVALHKRASLSRSNGWRYEAI